MFEKLPEDRGIGWYIDEVVQSAGERERQFLRDVIEWSVYRINELSGNGNAGDITHLHVGTNSNEGLHLGFRKYDRCGDAIDEDFIVPWDVLISEQDLSNWANAERSHQKAAEKAREEEEKRKRDAAATQAAEDRDRKEFARLRAKYGL